MYENEANPVIRNFWLNLKKNDSDFHVFKKNRNFVFFGDKLAEKSFDFVSQRINQLDVQSDMGSVSHSFFRILQNEEGHTAELKNLAIKAVQQIFEVPDDLLDANLNEDADVELNESTKDRNYDYDSLSQELKDQINKRILLNAIIQGASIHTFYTMHHLVRNELDAIDENLVKLYDQFAVGSVSSYYSIDYSSMVKNVRIAQSGAVGSVKVDYDEDTPKVVANAKSFPVLCQELVKGIMETICLHGLQNISKEDLDKIYYFADSRVDEPRYIQIGSQIWRYILKASRSQEDNLSNFIMEISMMTPQEIETFFENLLEQDCV